MATATHLQITDDDEFDWEAAVREIDIASEATKLSPAATATATATLPIGNLYSRLGPGLKAENNKPTTCRQSTLDKFIGWTNQKTSMLVENQTSSHDAQDKVVCDDERLMCAKIDLEAAQTWIYPENVPVRDYQVSITKTALFSNTLVSLPTGLGKTLIAAVVMYNYFRWFPEGKIVFTAPSRPLVMQQIEACHNTVGIPQEWTIDMTGQTSPTRRASLWKAKRVFFVTPQVLEKDIQSGSCLVKKLVCLVIDEAHHASGNYSYCVAVRELMAVPVQLRILALTATPGSNQQMVQKIIDNLWISSLEYRNESDPDVTPYIHNRKIELLEVAMGQDAVEVNNLLLDVIRPFVLFLSAKGVLPKRDIQTLSPCDLLNSRDKFRQAPPQDLPQLNYGDVEGSFGVLITLYHIRKLLSSHGIRPAFEVLEEKLKQGSFARYLSRNEDLWKAKVLMQQNLSHGALSPKISKLIEVLIAHFKSKDPQKTRVIIFSNFRGSVRDIMKALATVGEYVKATEFIGQSSGKTLKGQSQKVQQAVLEKFRAGRYNVIVATSIGEEGLDIMEVDLVVCFDANVSPLRMIQRMGRTGRKNEGRVVVLACEGLELKGYMRKQANGRAIKKQMRNGGVNSFRFHSSPRMVPHALRPAKIYASLSIKEFVPRGKKVKDDDAMQTPEYKVKLNEADCELLAKYFHPSMANNWSPSLIAFPHFQAFPSRVHEVAHSVRTMMLINTMQCLQELCFSSYSKAFFGGEAEASEERFSVESVEHGSIHMREDDLIKKEAESNESPMDNSRIEENQNFPDIRAQDHHLHSLFGLDVVSVDPLGKVFILSVPLLRLKQVSPSKSSGPGSTFLLSSLKFDSGHLRASVGECQEMASDETDVSTMEERRQWNGRFGTSSLQNSSDMQEERLDGDETGLQMEFSNLRSSIREVNTRAIPCAVFESESLLLADKSISDSRDADLSPKLTNLLKCGVVPESPIENRTSSEGKGGCMSPDLDRLPMLCTPVNNSGNNSIERCISASKVVEEIQNPPTNLSNSSCSKNLNFSSGEKSESVGQKQKLNRLRRYGDVKSRRPFENRKEAVTHAGILGRSSAGIDHAPNNHGKGEKNLFDDVTAFIEEEAEVSSDVAVSDDEENDHEQDSCDNFIDDGISPTMPSTQAEASRCDMMAIYRRSLLSQSPIRRKPKSIDFSSDNIVPMDRGHHSGSSTPNPYLHTSMTDNGNSSSSSLSSQRFSSDAIPSASDWPSKQNESRKRKLSFSQSASPDTCNLKQETMFNSEAPSKESSKKDPLDKIEGSTDAFDDDGFYQGIDLDAVEEQAAKQLKSKSQLSLRNGWMSQQPISQNIDFLGLPSFDLGI